ncbi:MAG: hypothetical protein P8X74_01925 [Reinekea sp.]
MPPKNFNKPMGAPAIFEKQTEIKLLHPASAEEVTDSGKTQRCTNRFTRFSRYS